MYTPEFTLVSAWSGGSTTNIGAAMVRSATGGQEVGGEQSREAPLLKLAPDQDRVHEASCSSDGRGEAADAFHSAGKTAAQDQRGWGRGIWLKPRPHRRPAVHGPAAVTCVHPRTAGDAAAAQQPMGWRRWEERRCA